MFRGFHWIGVSFIFIASILLLITSISSPVIGDIGILKVTLTNKTDFRNSAVTFGTFGHCVLDVAPVTTDQDYCSKKAIGYKPAAIMSEIDGTSFSRVGTATADGLTNAFVLHPVASGLAFIAGLCAIGGWVGSLVATLIAILAWIIALVVMVIDFVVFGVIKNHVNKDGSGSHAFYSVAMWTTLAAMILLFLGAIIVFFTCCTGRKDRSRTTSRHSSRRYSRREMKY